jgi:hypothetical protein
MAVHGGAEALAAVREGLEHLRGSLASAGLDLGDVALRADAGPGTAAPTSASGQGLDGHDPGAAARPDPGAGAPGGEQRPARERQAGPGVDGLERSSAAAGPRTTAAGQPSDASPDVTEVSRGLDVRI